MMCELELCGQCGSGDIVFEAASVRYYCADCANWSPINQGDKEDAIVLWNRSNQVDTTLDDLREELKALKGTITAFHREFQECSDEVYGKISRRFIGRLRGVEK